VANEARYPIKVESNAAQVGAEGAAGLEQLRAKLEESKAAVKSYGSQLKELTGDSKEVLDAKKALVDKLNAEKTAISQGSLELAKAGASYDKLAAAHKKQTDENKRANDEAKKAIDAKKKEAQAAAELKAETIALADAEALAAVAEAAETAGLTVLTTAVAALTVALPAAIIEFGKFAIVSSNLLRTQQLTREGFVGNAIDAEHLGNQVDELARKIPLGRAELNAMANDMAQGQLQGKALVDSLNAVGQETAAVNEKAGKQLQDLLSRGQFTNRFALGYRELEGTGLKFQDVTKALATNTKTSVEEATQALLQGRVTLADGAEAMKDAVEQKFGGLNLRKMLDLNVIAKKFWDTLDLLTKDIHLDGLLKSFKSLTDLFDQGNESGAALKELVTFLGQGLVDSMAKGTPALKGFIETLEIKALDLETAYLDLKIQFEETFGPDVLADVDAFKVGVGAAETAVQGLAYWAKPIEFMVGNLKDAAVALEKIIKLKGSLAPSGGAGGVASPLLSLLPSFAVGLEEVPSDDFPARLHKGERVLTKDEADSYRRIEALSTRAPTGGGGAGVGGTAQPSFSATISVTVQAPAGNAAPTEQVKESARRGTLEALEIFARQRGLVLT